ncbi:MAG: sugar ABC transporter permease [Oscillospiraceae bacterium]|jgi:multiple sugar transport system permease protein|nr:sugar ABC transporter permease [Oscillospiraceae bacterium]
MKSSSRRSLPFLLPSLLGILGLYILPYIMSYYYSFTDIDGKFAGLANFRDVLGSQAFKMALGNTSVFMLICVPLNVIVSFFLANLLYHTRIVNKICLLLFMLPLVIPSGATVAFWQNVIPGSVLQSDLALFAIIVVFMFKNVGFNTVLLVAGLEFIPRTFYEVASIEGAGGWRIFHMVTIPFLSPTLFVAFLMSFVNSFKIFREIFLLFGNYPHKSIYMLQHYMNNQFFAANLQKLSAASSVISVLVTVVIAAMFWGQKKFGERL